MQNISPRMTITRPRPTSPLIADNCPDPAVVRAGDGWVLACTSNLNDAPDKLPLYRSPDLARWEPMGFVFPRDRVPSWAISDFWAPEIHRVGDRWVCWYTARDRSGLLCLGMAESETIDGPFRDLGAPMMRDEAGRVGLIDAHFFGDREGRGWLAWKVDGNGQEPMEPTPIYLQELAPGDRAVRGERFEILTNDLGWEGAVVEGPWIVERDGFFHLFYAGNAYDTDAYATGVARARSLSGPFEKRGAPILVSGERWKGPGHGCLVTDGERDWFIHHAWERNRIGGRHPRMACVAEVRWHDGWPSLLVV